MRFHELHVFDTGKDDFSSIEVTVPIEALSHDAAWKQASDVRCRLAIVDGVFYLQRSEEKIRLDGESVVVKAIPLDVRKRIGPPIHCDDPTLAEQAIAGLLDGSRVINEDELIELPFSLAWLADDEFAHYAVHASHIAYGVYQKD